MIPHQISFQIQIRERQTPPQPPPGVRQHPQRRVRAPREVLAHDDAVGAVRGPRPHAHARQQVRIKRRGMRLKVCCKGIE